MEPVFMMLGQSAAVAACLAIDSKTPVQQVNVPQLQSLLKTNPLADSSTPEILVDNDDSTAVTVKGNWKRMANFDGCYGPSLLLDDAADKSGDFVRFTPDIKTEGNYDVYTYVVKASGSSSQITLLINDGLTEKRVDLNMKDIEVKGQTEGEWVSVGKFRLSAGNGGYVSITGKNANGIVLADAVLFIPERR
jgi:hypothetical protein